MNSVISITKKGVINVDNSTGKYAWTATVGTKGQIVIPKEAREIFNIQPGDTLIILADKEQGIAIPPKNTFEKYFQMIFGGEK
jgi:AbrB family looped-hinge helix DNA binding protein